ncbi:hypothetical protein GCK32_014853, partial [Trichostrongylus colubriformis]
YTVSLLHGNILSCLQAFSFICQRYSTPKERELWTQSAEYHGGTKFCMSDSYKVNTV